MRTLIIIISFIISLTGLLFKTTEDGKNGIKKLNKWGILLLSFMVVAVIINFITSRQEKINSDLTLQHQIEKDSLETREKQSRWKFDSLKMQDIINGLKSATGEIDNLGFPVDTLFLNFHLKFKIKENQVAFYQELLKGGDWYPRYDFNRFKYMSERNRSLYRDFNSTSFTVHLQSEDVAVSYEFEYAEVSKLLDDSYNFSTGYPNKKNETYSALYYDYNTNEIEIFANKAKCSKIEKIKGKNLKSLCTAKCWFSLFSPGLPTNDFDVKLLDIQLSNTKNDKQLIFRDFDEVQTPEEETYEWNCTKSSQCTFD